jgi:mono/diheme cytochrome c family protein
VNNFLAHNFRTAAGVAIVAALIIGTVNSDARQARPAGQGANAAAGNVQNGKAVFASQKCAACHGNNGEAGAGATGPQIAPPRLAMAMFAEAVRNPKDPMPAYSTTDISDAQLADLYAYLKSSTAPPVQTSAPAPGNAANGTILYVTTGCYECHNRDGSGGGAGPRLAPNPLAWGPFSHQVRSPSNAMPPYTTKVLSDSQLADIYAFVQTIPTPPALSSIPLLQQQQ